MQRCLTLLLIAVLLPTLCASQTVYVAPSGNDSTACASVTKQTPRKTLNGGCQCTPPGGTLEAADGTYDELLVGQVDSTTACQSSLAQIQAPCRAIPNGPDADHPTRLVAPGGNVVVSPQGRAFPGGGGIV